MIAWRICKKDYAEDPLSGMGGVYAAGRWNRRGKRILYAAGSPELCQLEILVNVGQWELFEHYTLVKLEIKEQAIIRLDPEALASDWRSNSVDTRDIGSQWLHDGVSVALEIPSVLTNYQNNYLLNPQHPDFATNVELVTQEAFMFDSRLQYQ